MEDLIQYLQTLPIKPLAWVAVSALAVASVVAIVFVCVIYNFIF